MELESNHSMNLEDDKRKVVLDSPVDLTPPRSGGGLSTSNLLPLATHLMESPNLTSRLCTDPRVIFNIANSFDKVSVGLRIDRDAYDRRSDEFPILPIGSNDDLKSVTLDQLRNLEALTSAVFKQVTSDSNVKRRQEYRTEFLKQLRSRYNEDGGFWIHKVHQKRRYCFGSCSITYALLSTIEDWNAIDIGVRSLAADFSRQSTERFQQGINLVESGDLGEECVLLNLWYAIRTMNLGCHGCDHDTSTSVDGNNDSRERQPSNFKLRELFLRSHLLRSDTVGTLPHELLRRIQLEAYRLLTKTSDWNDAFDVALLLLRSGLNPEEYSGVLSIWCDFVTSEESLSKRGMELERLWSDAPDKQTLELLHAVITSLEPLREEPKSKYTTMRTFLEGLLPRLCRIMRNANSIGEFCCSANSIHTILRTKVRIHLCSV